MSATDLAAYLRVLKDAGVMAANVKTDGLEFAVTFAPGEAAPLPGEAPEPGGWKGPANLDVMPAETPERQLP